MNPDIDTIKALNLFEGLSSEELDDVVAIISFPRVLEGERLIRAGEAATHFYIVFTGSFMLHAADGRAVVIHDPGDVMGMSCILGDSVYQISATALTDGIVLAIPGEDFQQIVHRHVELGQKLIDSISAVARETDLS